MTVSGTYRIADHVFRFDTLYEDVHQLCCSYRSDESAEFIIETTQEDIDKETAATIKECALENAPYVPVSAGVHEMMAVYIKVTECLFAYDILLYHGSAVAVDGDAYMFIAKSGTGKSTHSRMWRELFGEKAIMVNDDKPLVRISDRNVLVYGTPWNGKHRLGNNIAVPLKGICVIHQGKKNTIRQITLQEAYPMLLQQVYRLPGREALQKEMTLIDRMASQVRFYTMNCDISTDAARMAYEAMSAQER